MTPSRTVALRVVIVGAGPAGAAAAWALARRGARVTMLDRHRFPRDKVCGDGCSPRCVRTLEQMGIDVGALEDVQPVSGFSITAPGGHIHEGRFPPDHFGARAAVVRRAVLDARLVERAVSAGAELRERHRVKAVVPRGRSMEVLLSDGKRLHADVVLGCDGAPSVVRRSLGAPAFLGPRAVFAVRAYFENVRLRSPHAFSIVFDPAVLPGYFWVFPLPGDRANVGTGMRADRLARSKTKLKDLFERLCATPRIRRELAEARRVGPVVGHQIPLGSFANASTMVFDRALLLGDAAGFVNPISGEGIEFALASGFEAATTLEEADRRGDLSAAGLAPYFDRCNAAFRAPFDLAHRLTSAFRSPWLLDHLVRRASGSRAFDTLLADLFAGLPIRRPLSLLGALACGR